MGNKPLGFKAYGSIAHLPDSRMGPADHHCHEGQAAICTSKARDRHDRIICLEKIDGACVSVANINGDIVPLIRAGYRAIDAKYEHLRRFHCWATSNANRFSFLRPGQRIVGEWVALAHGTVYTRLPSDPFIIFDIFEGKSRLPYDLVTLASETSGLSAAPVISDGAPITVPDALDRLGAEGNFGAVDGPEGVVYRVERKGCVDFLAKFVKPTKIDGQFLPEISGLPEIWNWQPAPSKEGE